MIDKEDNPYRLERKALLTFKNSTMKKSKAIFLETTDGHSLSVQVVTPTVDGIPQHQEISIFIDDRKEGSFYSVRPATALKLAECLIKASCELIGDTIPEV